VRACRVRRDLTNSAILAYSCTVLTAALLRSKSPRSLQLRSWMFASEGQQNF